MHAIRFDAITLGIDLHDRHGVVEFHVALADLSTALDGLDSFLQVVRFDSIGSDRGGGDEGDGCAGDEGREHGAHEDGLNGGDGGVGVALDGRWRC